MDLLTPLITILLLGLLIVLGMTYHCEFRSAMTGEKRTDVLALVDQAPSSVDATILAEAEAEAIASEDPITMATELTEEVVADLQEIEESDPIPVPEPVTFAQTPTQVIPVPEPVAFAQIPSQTIQAPQVGPTVVVPFDVE